MAVSKHCCAKAIVSGSSSSSLLLRMIPLPAKPENTHHGGTEQVSELTELNVLRKRRHAILHACSTNLIRAAPSSIIMGASVAIPRHSLCIAILAGEYSSWAKLTRGQVDGSASKKLRDACSSKKCQRSSSRGATALRQMARSLAALSLVSQSVAFRLRTRWRLTLNIAACGKQLVMFAYMCVRTIGHRCGGG